MKLAIFEYNIRIQTLASNGLFYFQKINKSYPRTLTLATPVRGGIMTKYLYFTK